MRYAVSLDSVIISMLACEVRNRISKFLFRQEFFAVNIIKKIII